MQSEWQLACPTTSNDEGERVTLAHGEGGLAMRRLIERRLLPRLDNELLAPLADGARLPAALDGPLVFTTDSYVVSPLFFPGGDIGKLAVYGTANDLAVCGARPRWLSLSLILEEGLPLSVLDRVIESVAEAARRIGVTIATGDTKVVPRGAADRLFINTAGIGTLVDSAPPGPAAIRAGDQLLVSGPIARHGIAVLAAREQLGFDPPPTSDCAPLWPAVAALCEAKLAVRAIRDATRGGVAAVLHEWAHACGQTLSIDEASNPLTGDVRGACELLGLDPLNIACEGTMLLAVPANVTEAVLKVLAQCPETRQAARIGEVKPRTATPVTVRRTMGTEQPLDEPLGAPLPRIC